MEDSRAILKEIFEQNIHILPDIYIDDALFKAIQGECGDGGNKDRHKWKVYEINGVPFEDIQVDTDDEYAEIEIVEEAIVDSSASYEKDKEFWEKANGEFASDDTSLAALTIQEVRNGVIVNSNVFLPEENWHTIVKVEGGYAFCVVCASICTEEYRDHVDSGSHRRNLQINLPLDYYDLNIIRKVEGKYHCGVCNEITTIAQIHHHLASKSHEEHLLTAINKVSDIIDQYDPADDFGQSPSLQETSNCEGFYDYPGPSCSRNGYVSGSDAADEGTTYASMASTPKKMPQLLEIDMGKRKAWVQTENWHMIVTPKPNKFYCMVCKTEGPAKKKSEHCSKKQHLDKLAKCTMMKQYKHHLVRKVDNILLHCGHCNNLRLTSDIEDHLAFRHPTSKSKDQSDPQKASKTTNGRNTPNQTAAGQIQASPSNVPAQTNPPRSNANAALPRSQANSPSPRSDPVNSLVQLDIFGARFVIPVLNFNMVLIVNGFFCCLCEETVTIETLARHLSEVRHLEKLKKNQFIFNLGCNLVRVIRDGFHCGICNVAVPYNLILSHIRHYIHLSFLNNAMVPLIPVQRPEPAPIPMPTPSSNKFSLLKDVSDTPEPVKVPKPPKDIPQSIPSVPKVDQAVALTPIVPVPDVFDEEGFVYVRLDNVAYKIGVCSYNTLVVIGDGTRHCFVCSKTLSADELGDHVRRRDHQENLVRNKFLDKRKASLLRQQYVTYHCGVCNALVPSRDLNVHLTWPVHLHHEENAGVTKKRDKKKMKEKELYDVGMQKECIYNESADPKINFASSYKFSKEAVKKYKMVIVKGSVARIEWSSWHGFHKLGDGFMCILCQVNLDRGLIEHTKDVYHARATENFLGMHLPDLIRLTRGEKLHCVTCNVILEKHDSVFSHVYSKNHKKTYKSILKSSSEAESFVDCSRDVFSVDES